MGPRFGALFTSWRLLRGDAVKIIAGKDKGQTGTIARVLRDSNRVVVEGLNLVKKHVKQGGGIVTVEAPLHVSNVALVDPQTGAAVRSTFKFLEDGTKARRRGRRTEQASACCKVKWRWPRFRPASAPRQRPSLLRAANARWDAQRTTQLAHMAGGEEPRPSGKGGPHSS